MSGGGNDDIIIGGNEILGQNIVFGDQEKDTMEDREGADQDNDGNDIIDIGDDNQTVLVWAQGGNDKIVGGIGSD